MTIGLPWKTHRQPLQTRREEHGRAIRRVDKRFDAMGAAIDARFWQVNRNIESIGEKLDGIVRTLRGNYQHQQKTLDEHDNRLKGLERAARA